MSRSPDGKDRRPCLHAYKLHWRLAALIIRHLPLVPPCAAHFQDNNRAEKRYEVHILIVPISTMADDLVLLTGATGHLGFKVLRSALEAGYTVRAAVRSEQKATILKSNRVLKATPGFSKSLFRCGPRLPRPRRFRRSCKRRKIYHPRSFAHHY